MVNFGLVKKQLLLYQHESSHLITIGQTFHQRSLSATGRAEGQTLHALHFLDGHQLLGQEGWKMMAIARKMRGCIIFEKRVGLKSKN